MNCPTCGKDNIPGEDLCRNCGMDLAGLDVEAWGLDPGDPVLARPLSDLPLREAIVLSAQATVSEAIELMQRHGTGCIMVAADSGALTGIFTEHDVMLRVAARGRDPKRTRLEKVMTPNPVTLQQDDPLAWALHRMGVDGYRHLPVLDDEKLKGFLSIRVVLQAFHEA